MISMLHVSHRCINTFMLVTHKLANLEAIPQDSVRNRIVELNFAFNSYCCLFKINKSENQTLKLAKEKIILVSETFSAFLV